MQIPTVRQEAIRVGLTRVWKEHAIREAMLWHRAPYLVRYAAVVHWVIGLSPYLSSHAVSQRTTS